MDESSKKSTPNFDAAPAGSSLSKSAMNGKREAEDELEKQVLAKKQKIEWVAENQKKEEKVPKKKESSSDDSFSDSEEDEKHTAASKKLVAKNWTLHTGTHQGKQASSSSSSGNSDDDSRLNDSKVVPGAGKGGPSVIKNRGESSSDTGSNSGDEDDIKTEVTILPEKLPAAGKKEPAEKVESSKASHSDSDSRTDEDKDNVSTSSKKLFTTSATGNNISTKKVGSSNDSSLDSGLDEDDVQKTHATSLSKKLPASAAAQRDEIEKNDNSCDESREGFDECNVSEESEKIQEKPSKTPQKDVKEDEMVDAASRGARGKEVPKTAATREEQNAALRKIFVGNLSPMVNRTDLEYLFKDCGEILDVRFSSYRDGSFKGFAHVEFATEEAAQNALMLNGSELFRRFVRIETAREKYAYTPHISCVNRNKSFKGYQASFVDEPKMSAAPEQNATSKTLFVGNLSYSVERADLENLFKDCGEIVDIRFATDHEGKFKGFGYAVFATEEAAQMALMLNGKELLRRSVKVDIASERSAYSRNSNNRNESSQEYTSLGGNEPKMSASLEQNTTSKTLFVGNLSYSVERADLENLFKDCGEIVDIRFATDHEGRFKGFGYVVFATEEAAQMALMLNGKELLRRSVKVDIASERSAYSRNSNCSNRNESSQDYTSLGGNEPKMSAAPEQNATSKTLFVGNLSYSVERADLENLFKDCGEIVDIRFATDREGRFKGFGYVVFATEEAAQMALMLNGKELLRRSVKLDIASEKGAYARYSKNESSQEYTSLGGNEAKIPAAPGEQNATSKTVFVGNLSYGVRKTDLENLFKDCGEIVDIRLATDCEGRFKGFGHVEFATQEGARNALKLNGNELLRQYIRLDLAREKIVYSSNSRNDSGTVESQTVFVRGFDTSLGEYEIRTRLEEHFSSCGMISRISIARDYGTGSTKGYAWLDFMHVDGFNKALELDGTEVGGYVLSVEKRRPRRYIQDDRGGGDQFGGWRGGDQLGEWHGGGQWGQGRGYGSRWH